MTPEPSSWSIDSDYIDARGRRHTTDPATVEILSRTLEPGGVDDDRRRRVVALRCHEPQAVTFPGIPGPVRWQLLDDGRPIASGKSNKASVALPANLPVGSYHLAVDAATGFGRDVLVLVAPHSYQPPLFVHGGRIWLLTIQLYGVRSARNWGHGDFTDLARMLHIAAHVGAGGVGVNPLHALAPGEASSYSPSSRLFLNPLYIDVEAVPEFPGLRACRLTDEVARLRALDVIDYAAVYAAKRKALKTTYEVFQTCAATDRRDAFAHFRERLGESLANFAIFESLRERFGSPWLAWPPEWQQRSHALARYKAGDIGNASFQAFIQWIADQQLRDCAHMARQLALPIGLYLDVAVGVEADGADAWSAPHALQRGLSIGAPPDIYNPAGQNWGLAVPHPQVLIDSDFSLFRQTLRSVMQYAGAIRVDHALGLNRLFVIPNGVSAANGGYIRFPFEAMLAVIAQESTSSRCLVVGEDLGTVPEGVCETLNRWGIWSYRVAMFEREHADAFRRPETFPEKAIVTFNTHDLPTFAGWKMSHDLRIRAALGLDAGESEAERQQALSAMRATLVQQALSPDLSLLDLLRYLARTPSQILAVSIEDVLGVQDQPNMPGTTAEHPNWRRRLPLDIDEIARHEMLHNIAGVMASEGRARVDIRR
jgi:4-alpha-glucanotransferase